VFTKNDQILPYGRQCVIYTIIWRIFNWNVMECTRISTTRSRVLVATPTPPTECKDEEDCGPYGQDVCTDFKDFASRQCRAFCKFCDAPGKTLGPVLSETGLIS